MDDKIAKAVEKAITQATAPLIEELHKGHTEISRLKAIINKDSSNSSKPSGTNGYSEDKNAAPTYEKAEKLSFFESEYNRIVEEGRLAIMQMNDSGFGYNEFNAMLTCQANFTLRIKEKQLPKRLGCGIIF